MISAPALTPGLALLDAPDIDSVVDANRDLAGQLLAAADLWLFVTTAARYADAVPWGVLRAAHDRGTVIAMVLDRVPLGADEEVAAHLREMLEEQHLANTTLFILPETTLDGSGLLPDVFVRPIREWLADLAGDAAARSDVIRTTVSGAVRSIVIDVDALAQAADDQSRAWTALDAQAREAYDAANSAVEQGVEDGAVAAGRGLSPLARVCGYG